MKSKTVSISMPDSIILKARRSAKKRSQKFSEWMRDAALSRLDAECRPVPAPGDAPETQHDHESTPPRAA
jgi:hypothetical protein